MIKSRILRESIVLYKETSPFATKYNTIGIQLAVNDHIMKKWGQFGRFRDENIEISPLKLMRE